MSGVDVSLHWNIDMSLRRCAILSALVLFSSLDVASSQDLSTQDMIDRLKEPRKTPTRSLSANDIGKYGDMPGFMTHETTRGLKIEERKQLDEYVSSYDRPVLDIYIGFGLNSSALTDSAQTVLRDLAVALTSSELSGSKFSLSGHTDASGTSENNQFLSERRALSVRDFLASHGVLPHRLIAAGYGEERPKQGLDPEDPKNRRVEIINLGTP